MLGNKNKNNYAEQRYYEGRTGGLIDAYRFMKFGSLEIPWEIEFTNKHNLFLDFVNSKRTTLFIKK